MQTPAEADRWFDHFGLSDAARFSDPSHALYRAFGLQEGSLFELAHPRVWVRWMRTASTRGAGPQGSHWRQLTGVFLVDRDRVLAAMRHRDSSARPDYLAFVRHALGGRHDIGHA